MKKIINFLTFNVFTVVKEEWDVEYHNHNFYEMIFVVEGYGKHNLNNVIFPYQKGDIFLLTPQDSHEFEINSKTTFIYLKYNELFLKDQILGSRKNKSLKDAVLYTLLNRPVVYQSIVQNQADSKHLFEMVKILMYEHQNKENYATEIISNLFLSIITIVSRNINLPLAEQPDDAAESEKLQKILSYINLHIFEPELMKIENLATKFSISANYISIYIKKHTGFSIQQHIMRFKIKAAEQLILQSRLNYNEIAQKLGFTDASHFTKIFKKYNGLTPGGFKESSR